MGPQPGGRMAAQRGGQKLTFLIYNNRRHVSVWSYKKGGVEGCFLGGEGQHPLSLLGLVRWAEPLHKTVHCGQCLVMRRVARHVLGWIFLGLGVVGSLLPILQGWFFFAVGALLLAPDIPLFARLFCWIEARFPKLKAPLHRLRHRLGQKKPPCDP